MEPLRTSSAREQEFHLCGYIRSVLYMFRHRLYLVSRYPLFGEHCDESGYQAQAKASKPHSINPSRVRPTPKCSTVVFNRLMIDSGRRSKTLVRFCKERGYDARE